MEKKVVVRYLVLALIFAGLIVALMILRHPGLLGFAIFQQANETDFNPGTYDNTTYSGGAIILDGENLSGSYISIIFDAGNDASWNNISWLWNFSGEYMKQELADNKEVETGYGIDMTGNVLLLHMNEASGAIVDTSGEGNNGTYNGALYSQTGKLNTAIGFDGSNDYINHGNILDFERTDNFSIGAWIKTTKSSPTYAGVIISKMQAPDHKGWLLDIFNGQIRFILEHSYPGYNISAKTTLTSFNDGNWHCVVVTYDGSSSQSGMNIYVDGIEASVSRSGGSVGGTTQNSGDTLVGHRDDVSNHLYQGKIDELAVWNRTLSADEVFNIYKRGILELNLSARTCDDDACSGESFSDIADISPQTLALDNNQYFQYKFGFSTDNSSFSPALYNVTIDYTILNTAPSISLVSPQDGATYGTNESLALNFIASDADDNIDSCWYNINGGINVIITGCQNTTFDVSGNGDYALDIYVNDTNGEEASDSSNFSVQVGAPTIELHSPIDSYLDSGSVTFTYTPTDIDLDSCELWGDFTGSFALNQTNTSVNTGEINSFNLNLDDGTYLWNIQCNDSFGNIAINGNRTFYVDTIVPSISLSQPTGTKTSRTIAATWSVSDNSPISCLYNVYRGSSVEVSNTSIECNLNSTSFNVTVDADFSFNFYADDSAGNENSASLEFNVDTSTSEPSPSGGDDVGSSALLPSSKLSIDEIPSLILDSGESDKIILKIKNSGFRFLNDCKIKGKGDYSSWISSEDIKGLSAGEEVEFMFTLTMPSKIESELYNIEAEVECQELTQEFGFVVEVLSKKLDINLINVEKGRDLIEITYSLTELYGQDQEVEVEILLFDINNERVAELTETKSVSASSNQEFEAILPIADVPDGNYNLLINANSDISSGFLQEEVILGSSRVGGLAIFSDDGTPGSFFTVFLIGIFVLFAILIVRRIVKLKKAGKLEKEK